MKNLLFIMLILFAGILFASVGDLSGTWIGTTSVDGTPVTLTMVLEKSGESYSGTISDDVGFTKETKVESLELKGNEMSFYFDADNGSEYVRVTVQMTVEENSMSGVWESEDGDSGPIEMKKK
jgi:hypothetical protein